MIFGITCLSVVCVGFIVLAIRYSNSSIPALVGILLWAFGVLGVVAGNINHESKAKIDALHQFGIEPLSKEEVYNSSKADLDKCFCVSTLNGTYYFVIIGEK